MSEDTLEDLSSRLAAIESIAKLAPWLKGLIVGAFLLGGWVVTIELRVESLTKELNELKSFQREVIELKTDVKWIRENLKK
jgi:hypothetical protein